MSQNISKRREGYGVGGVCVGYRQWRRFTIWLGASPRWPVALPRCHPAGSLGGSFENLSEALGLLSRMGLLEVGVRQRALENLLDGSDRLPKPRCLALAGSDHVAHAGLYPRTQQVSPAL